MGIPFLNQKKMTSTLMSRRKANGKITMPEAPEVADSQPEDGIGLASCMQEFAMALKAEDFKGAANALACAFEILDTKVYQGSGGV